MTQQHWAQNQEKTNHWGIVFLLTIHQYLGRLPFRIFMGPVILFYWLMDKNVRVHSMDYLQRAQSYGLFKQKPTLMLSLRHLAFFGETILDKFLALTDPDDKATLAIENDQMIMDCIARKQGAIVLTSHMGCIEKLINHGLQQKETELVILMHSKHAQQFNALLRDRNQALKKIHFMEVSALTPASACEIETYVARGALVFIAGDRIPIASDATCEVSFLGHKARFPIGGTILANLFHCPLFSITCWRTPKKMPVLSGQTHHYTVRFGNLSNGKNVYINRHQRREDISILVEGFVRELEAGLAKSPLDWANFYAFWPQTSENLKSDAKDKTC